MTSVNTYLRRLTTAAALLLSALAMNAQVDAGLTNYQTVPAYYNPAATGLTDYIHISAGSRLQWVGIHHAPMTFMVLADMPFKLLDRRWGTGVIVESESMGLYRSTIAGAQLSWKKNMLKGTLHVGFQAGIINESFRGSKADPLDTDPAHTSADDAIPDTDVGGTAFDISAGVWFTHKWFWVGISSTHLTAPTISLKAENNEEDIYEFDAGRLYYFMAGSNIPIKNTLFEVRPSVMVKSDFNFVQAEATAVVRYNKFLSFGVGYRHKDAVSVLLGADWKNFHFGYSYDYATTAISKASTGSHEVFLQYNVKLDMGEKNRNKHKSIRIM